MFEPRSGAYEANEIKLNVLVPGVPQIQDLITATLETQHHLEEHGISVYATKEGDRHTLFTKSKGQSIFEPDIPSSLKGKIKSGIFIHCHPISTSEEVNGGRSLHILPSAYSAFAGDFAANLWSRVIGGYLNIASKYGLTINIGIDGISRDEDVTRTLREKVNAYDLATEKVWKVLSGQKGSMSFNQMEARQAIDDKFTMDEDVLLRSYTDRAIGTKYFLHLSWEKIQELEQVFSGLDNFFFGDGLDRLIKHLNLDVTHEKNLAMAARKFAAMPQTRIV